MTIDTISQASPVAQVQPASSQTAVAKPETAPAAKLDIAQISEAAKASSAQAAAQALLQEAIETSTQTAQEANHGDRQAQRLVAKYAAARQH